MVDAADEPDPGIQDDPAEEVQASPEASRLAAPTLDEVAVTVADAVLFVVDAGVGITDADEAVVRILRKAGKPVVLAANKVDDQRGEMEAAGLWNLGLGEPYPVSALHGRGSGDLLDAILDLPEQGRFGLAAVVEEVGGTKTYWALAHGAATPDFHHPACFAADLPPVADE